jgi:glutaconate CoA-transferase subunit A
VQYGAHPTSLYRCYDYDAEHLEMYASRNKSESSFAEYLHEYVLEPKSHSDYLERVGGEARLATLKADAKLGY